MNADKFTQKTIETIQTAQSMAQENGNQYLTPEHLLYALVDADGGLIGTLLGRMGVDCNAVLSELDTAINQLPKVSGGSGEVYASPETSKIFNFAEREAKSGGDAYVSVEHLMLGIFANETAAIKRIFSAHGITKAGFTAELKKVKTGPVTSDNPEDTYDALKKYGTDLVERAREGKDGSGHRPRSERSAMSSASLAQDEEQPRAHRRAGRRQDGHRRRTGAAHRARRRARGPEGQDHFSRSTWARWSRAQSTAANSRNGSRPCSRKCARARAASSVHR